MDFTLIACAVIAVAVSGLAKGGFAGLGVLSMPLLALVMPPVKAAAVMLPILIIQDAVSVLAYRRSWDGRNLAILLPGSVAGIALGWAFSSQINEAAVRLMVGLIALVFAARALFLPRREQGAAQRGGVPQGLFWGTVAGFTSFVSHAGAPPFQVYVMPQRLAPLVYAGTNTMFFAATNLIKVAPYFLLGQFGTENLMVSAALAPVAIGCALAGVWLVRRVSAETFYAVILWLTLGVGAKLVFDGGRALAGL